MPEDPARSAPQLWELRVVISSAVCCSVAGSSTARVTGILQLMLVISRQQFHVDNASVDDDSLPLLPSVAVTSLAAELA